MIIRVLFTCASLCCLTSLSVSHAQTEEECRPQCRSGYFCDRGRCASRCNPPCNPQQICSDQGECFEILDDIEAASDARSALNSETDTLRDQRTWEVEQEAEWTGEAEPEPETEPKPELEVDREDDKYTDIALSTQLTYGVSGGVALPDQVYVPELQEMVNTSGGWALRVFVDHATIPDFISGLYVNFISLLTPEPLERSTVELMSFGVTFKYVARLDPETEIRAGLGLGIQISDLGHMGQIREDPDQESHHVQTDLAPLVEISFKVSNDMNALVGATVFSQMTQSEDETSLEWRPALFLSGGVEFK